MKHVKAESAGAGGETYRLRLFVAGDEPNSRQARENLVRLCEEHLERRYELEIIDVLEDFRPALQDGVLVTPTLLLVAPPPRVMVLGNLSDTPKALRALRLTGGEG